MNLTWPVIIALSAVCLGGGSMLLLAVFWILDLGEDDE